MHGNDKANQIVSRGEREEKRRAALHVVITCRCFVFERVKLRD